MNFEKNIKNKLRSVTTPPPATDADWQKVSDTYKKAIKPEKRRRFLWFFIGISAIAISGTTIWLLSDTSESKISINLPSQQEINRTNPTSAELKTDKRNIENKIYNIPYKIISSNYKQNNISPIKYEAKKELVKQNETILNNESSMTVPYGVAIITEKQTTTEKQITQNPDAKHPSPPAGDTGGHTKPTIKMNSKLPKLNKFSLSFETGITSKNSNLNNTDTVVKISSGNMQQMYMNLKIEYELNKFAFSSGLGYLHNTLQATYSQHVWVDDSFPVYNTQGQIIGYGHNLPKDSNIFRTTTKNLHYIQIPIAASYRILLTKKFELIPSINCNLNFNVGYRNLRLLIEPIKTKLPASLTGLNPLYINWQASLGMAYTLNKKLKIVAAPYLYTSQNKIYNNANDKFKGAGLQFSINYKL